MDEDQGAMPEGDYYRLELNRDQWKKRYLALEKAAKKAHEALVSAGRYLSHRPDATQTQPCFDWCPRCQVQEADKDLNESLTWYLKPIEVEKQASPAEAD